MRYDAEIYNVIANGHVGHGQLNDRPHGSWGMKDDPLRSLFGSIVVFLFIVCFGRVYLCSKCLLQKHLFHFMDCSE